MMSRLIWSTGVIFKENEMKTKKDWQVSISIERDIETIFNKDNDWTNLINDLKSASCRNSTSFATPSHCVQIKSNKIEMNKDHCDQTRPSVLLFFLSFLQSKPTIALRRTEWLSTVETNGQVGKRRHRRTASSLHSTVCATKWTNIETSHRQSDISLSNVDWIDRRTTSFDEYLS